MPSVHGKVAAELVRPGESFGAVWPGTGVGLLTSVGAHVRFEVVRTREFPLTDVALERPDSGVLPAVSPELVGAGESLTTPLMVADVRLLSGMLADVHLQVRKLQVTLGAAWVEANEGLPLFLSLHILLLANQVSGRLPDLGDDESGLGRHGHLDRSVVAVIQLGLSGHVGRDDLKGKRNGLVWDDLVGVAIGEGEDHVSVATV